MNTKLLAALGTLTLAVAVSVSAQSVVTEPVGFTTLTVAAKPAGTRGFTYLSVNMFRPTAYRAVVPTGTGLGATTVSGQTVLTFPAGTFTAGQFATGTSPNYSHFIELTNGSFSGVLADIASNTATTVTLTEDITSMITNGTTTFRARPHWTFGTLLAANAPGFLAGTSSTADTIAVLNPATGAYSTYYYSAGNNRWQIGLSTDASNVIIRPDAGLLIERKLATPVSITVVGEVKLGTTEVIIAGGSASGNYTLAPNPYPLSSVTLANSGLYTGSAATGVKSGTASTGDTVALYNSATGAFSTYYYSLANNRWQIGLSTDASAVTIPEGSSVLVFRRPGGGSFSWLQPQPTMNLN